MPTVTLNVKTYHHGQLRLIERLLKTELEGLKVQTRVQETTSTGWVQIALSGDDENVALRYLETKIGLCPESIERVGKFQTVKGRITNLGRDRQRLHVDVGVFLPSIVDATVSLEALQAQLADGRKVALSKISELFGFCENLPLSVKVSEVDGEKGQINAVLAEKQLGTYANWIGSLLDRLLILGAPLDEVISVVDKKGVSRDVADVESLGLLEHAVLCKLGTDAVGLIPRIGKGWRVSFSVFSPRRIIEFRGY